MKKGTDMFKMYRLKVVRGSSFPQLERPVNGWGFVRLSDLGDALGVSGSLVLANFWALSKDAYYASGPDSVFTVQDVEGIEYVNAGWASDVLRAHAAGVFVVLAYCEGPGNNLDEEPEHVWNSVFHNGSWTVAYAYDRGLEPVSVNLKYNPRNASPDTFEFLDD